MQVARTGTLQVLSRGIRETPHIDILLSALAQDIVYSRWWNRSRIAADAIAGWGYRASSARARALALRRGISYIALEDGFFRSVGLGAQGRPALSFVADDRGIYYDPQRRSRLHDLLAPESRLDESLLSRARALAGFIRENRLSKYNTGRDGLPPALARGGGRHVLVVDQTRGDASLCGVPDSAFSTLVAQARARHPGGRILLKTHPDVVAGIKGGCFSPACLAAPDVDVITEDINPHALFDLVDDVYVVSSGLGFEALIAGKTVHCAGRPWYAGYGLTDDMAAEADVDKVGDRENPFPPQAAASRTLDDMVAAACLLYPFYLDPYARTPSTPENAFDTLAFIKARADRLRGRVVAFGISPAKRRMFERYLPGLAAPPEYMQCSAQVIARAAAAGAPVVAWAGKVDERLAGADIPLIRVEDGFLRSVGLGAGLVPASSLVFDADGIYYDRHRASALERLIGQGVDDPDLLRRAQELRREILSRGLTKYNTGERALPDIPAGRTAILVAGQVEDDASVLRGTGDIATNAALLQAVREKNPDAYILYKPHPDVLAGYRRGHVDPAVTARCADMVCGDVSADAVLGVVDEVHVMSSLIGFEALLRGCDVHVYGMPFYAGWGLTRDHMTCARRVRRASLDELVAAALILYPDYVDPDSQLPCPPEVALRALSAGPRHRPSRKTQLYRRIVNGALAVRLLPKRERA